MGFGWDNLSSEVLEVDLENCCGSVIYLIQGLLEADKSNNLIDTPIYLVTQNSQPVGNSKISGLTQSSLWGIGKVAALETDFQLKTIDLDSKTPLISQLHVMSRD